jgi:RNA polymerase sigma-B factor
VQRTLPSNERQLFTRLRAAPSRADRQAAVERYLPLAHALAARYRHTSEPLDDLRQVAAIGLLNAIDRFDPARGTTFASYAVPTILGELRRHFRDRTWAMRVPRQHQELVLRLELVHDELAAALGHQPTVADLSQRLGVEPEMVLELFQVALARAAYPLEPPGQDDERDGGVPGLSDPGYGRVEDRAMLSRLLTTLSVRDAQIVFLRFHADLTQAVIARHFGMTQMHVSRVLNRCLSRLRDAGLEDAGTR